MAKECYLIIQMQMLRWIQDDAKAMVILSATIQESQLESLITCASAREMWVRLSAIHEQKSASNKLILTQRFHEYGMDQNDSVVQHVAKVRNMASALKDVDETVTDVAIMAKILASLPSKFNALKTAWDSVDANNQTVDNLMERLIKEENRLTVDDETASAFVASSNKEKRNHKFDKVKKNAKECWHCHKMGHISRDCFKKKRENQVKNKGDSQHEEAYVVTCRDRQSNGRFEEQIPALMTQEVSEIWLTDSGASKHITYRRDWLTDFRTVDNDIHVSLGDNGTCQALGTGTVHIEKFIDGKWKQGRIENVLYVSKMRKNLFSVGTCTNKNFEVLFRKNRVVINKHRKTTAVGVKQENDVYRMLFKTISQQVPPEEVNVSTSLHTWHKRLGHVSKQTLMKMSKTGILQGIQSKEEEKFQCESCPIGKSHRLSFKKCSEKRSSRPGEFIHSDVCGPMPVDSIGGAKFFVTFKDNATGFRFVYFIRHKSDVFDKFKECERLIANKFGRAMNKLRVDNGREYCSEQFKRYLKHRGISLETTAPYTPEQNGKIERDNRTIVECARTMLHFTNLPRMLWAEAVNTAVYILNRITCTQTPGTTPYEIWTEKKQDLSQIRIFGSEAFVHVPNQLRNKLDPKAKKMILVGYQGDSTNYRLYDAKTRSVKVSRNVTFNEKSVFSLPTSDEGVNLEFLETNSEESDNELLTNDNPVNLTKTGEKNNEKNNATSKDNEVSEKRRLRDRATLKSPERYCANVAEINVPQTYKEAITCANSEEWQEAIQEELRAHQNNNTWTLVPRDNNHKCIDSKWVFKIQRGTTGKLPRYRARLCARGFKQEQGTDYTETFSPVVRMTHCVCSLPLWHTKTLSSRNSM